MRKRDDKPAALDHALYEMLMLAHSLMALCRSDLNQADRNGWLEVFAVHARNLNEFFAKKDFGGAYMKPNHFIAWDCSYDFDSEIARRASGQVAHLTYDRERPEEKTSWPIERIFKGIRIPSMAFLNAIVGVAPLMNYQDNRARTEYLLSMLPKFRFPGDGA